MTLRVIFPFTYVHFIFVRSFKSLFALLKNKFFDYFKESYSMPNISQVNLFHGLDPVVVAHLFF